MSNNCEILYSEIKKTQSTHVMSNNCKILYSGIKKTLRK